MPMDTGWAGPFQFLLASSPDTEMGQGPGLSPYRVSSSGWHLGTVSLPGTMGEGLHQDQSPILMHKVMGSPQPKEKCGC